MKRKEIYSVFDFFQENPIQDLETKKVFEKAKKVEKELRIQVKTDDSRNSFFLGLFAAAILFCIASSAFSASSVYGGAFGLSLIFLIALSALCLSYLYGKLREKRIVGQMTDEEFKTLAAEINKTKIKTSNCKIDRVNGRYILKDGDKKDFVENMFSDDEMKMFNDEVLKNPFFDAFFDEPNLFMEAYYFYKDIFYYFGKNQNPAKAFDISTRHRYYAIPQPALR